MASALTGFSVLMCLCCCVGDVLLKQTYEKCVKPDGVFDGRKIAAKDVIDLKSGELKLAVFWHLCR